MTKMQKETIPHYNRTTKFHRLPSVLFGLTVLLSACSSLDCPVNNTVNAIYKMVKADGATDTLSDTISIVTRRIVENQDPVMVNSDVMITTLSIPVSYNNPEDELFFYFTNKDVATDTIYNSDDTYTVKSDTTYYMEVDTVVVTKNDRMHFESVDCNPSFFHTITGVRHTRNRIDSIVVNNPEVNYDTSTEHFRLYIRPRR